MFTPIRANVTDRTGKGGRKLPVVLVLALAHTPGGVCGGDRDTLGRGYFSGEQALECSA